MEFQQGQSLLSICWEDGEIIAGKYGYVDIVVVMENGDPWACATKDDGSVYKYNLKMCQGVRVK